MEPKRVDKVNYYLNIADAVLERSTCLRRHYGAIIVRNDEIVSTGYNGAPRGRKNCVDLGRCTREELQVPSGQRYELCRSVHAEANAIISAARSDTLGATLYLSGRDAKTGQLLGGHHLLLHVPSSHHQRRYRPGHHPQQQDRLQRSTCRRLDSGG